MIKKGSVRIITNSISKALEFAVEVHYHQRRKGDNKPYIIHPLGVALIVAKVGAADETIAAALLHDVLEDTKTTRAQLQERFGEKISKIVDELTEQNKSLPWKVRKDEVLKHIPQISEEALLVKAADLVFNLSSMIEAYQKEGPVIFSRFNAPLSDQITMHQKLYLALQKRRPTNPLLGEINLLLGKLRKIKKQL